MNRIEAEIKAGEEHRLYRPLSIGTMAILQQLQNAALQALLGGGSIECNYEDFVIFLFAHAREHNLGEVREMVRNGTIVQEAYSWVEGRSPMDIAEGVDYFTGLNTKAQLVAAEPAEDDKKTEKKTTRRRSRSSTSRQSSGTTSDSPRRKSTKRRTRSSSSSSTPSC